MPITRRQFVRQAATAALAAAALDGSSPAPAADRKKQPSAGRDLLPIVDTHQHLWDLGKLRLPWLKSAGKLNRNHLMSDYLQAARGLNVVKTVYMEVAVADGDLLKEAAYVIELCRRKDNPMAAAVIGGRPGAEGFREYITRFKGSPYVKGIRHILPGNQQELWGESRFVKSIRLLGELGMRFDLCMPPQRLPDAAKLVDACPATRFVLDHCGNADPQAFRPPASNKSAGQPRPPQHDADQWRRDIAALARRKQVVCKISGIIARADKDHWKPDDLAPIVNHCLEVFGPDRVMFAGDWPVCIRVATLRQWVEALKQIVAGRPEAHRRKLFHDNAVRFYGLTSA
jgi:L-fuconolactonase